MGLKWEYCQAPQKPLFEEHWDAQAFIQFFKKHNDEKIMCMSSGSLRGTKHQIGASIPAWDDQIKDALFQTVLKALEAAVLTAIATGSATVVITLPTWVPVAILVLILGEMARRQIWKEQPESKLMNIRLVCPTQELFDGVNHYFQGSWELP